MPTIPLETFKEIATTLLEKTKQGQVNWMRRKGSTPNDTIYEVRLPKSRIVLKYAVPTADPDTITLQLQNPDGEEVDSWVVDDPDPGETPIPIPRIPLLPSEHEREAGWNLLRSLFAEVHRHVTGWDKVVNDVKTALAGSGPIGSKNWIVK